MHGNEGSGRAPHYWHLVLIDGVSILISVSASLAVRFGTLAITPYVHQIRLVILLLVFLRLSLFALLGFYRVVRRPWRLSRIILLISAVILSSSITALVVFGLGLRMGLVHWFPKSLLIIELLPGIIMAGAIRLGQWAWDAKIASRHGEKLQSIRSRAGLMISIVFIALIVILLWQGLWLAAALLPTDWGTLLHGIPVMILTAILFLLPGYALLAIVRPRIDFDPLETLIVSTGLSVAIIALLLFFCSLIGFKLNRFSVGVIFVLLGAVALWHSLSEFKGAVSAATTHWSLEQWRLVLRRRHSLVTGTTSNGCVFYATLATIFLMALLVRLWVAKDLSVGMWGDSYHHTMIAQLLVDNGGLFSSWEPYAPLSSLTYHFGFHALVAFYHWLTGIPVTRSVVEVGQLINALAVPLMYLLTERLTRSRWAGLIAALIVGFLSAMPMYYVNWGRYTQLAGQTILPIAILFTLWSLLPIKRDWRAVVVTILALAGLILTHYRVTIMYFCFLPGLLLHSTYKASRVGGKKRALEVWLTVLAMAVGAAVLVSPWIGNLQQGFLPRMAVAQLGKPPSVTGLGYLTQLVADGQIFFYLDGYLLALSFLGAVLAIVERRRGPILIFTWIALLLFAVTILPVPGGKPTGNVGLVLIALYIPASLLSGFFLATLIRLGKTRLRQVKHVASVLVIVAAILGSKNLGSILAPETMLVTKADEKAMQWIKGNTSEEAKFLVNFYFAYEDTLVVGSDAGWWIPLLAGRENTVPPITYGSEASFEPNYLNNVSAFAERIEESVLDDPETLRLLRDNGVTHVYIGEKGGNLRPEFFANTPCYEVVYHENEVSILEVVYGCMD